MDGGQCSRTGSLLGERGAGSVAALGTGENAAGGEDQDVTVGELLLELAGETKFPISVAYQATKEGKDIPLLHSVETWKGWDGDKDDNSLLAVANFNLQRPKSACDLHVLSHLSENKTMVRSPSDSTTRRR